MAIGRPQLELGIAVGREPHFQDVALLGGLDVADHLGMAAIQPFGEAHDRAEQPHGLALRPRQIGEALMPLLGLRLTMIPGREGDDLDLVRIEAPQIPVFDEVVRVFVVPFVADVVADVVQ